jgi:hypothetical protein
MINVSPPPPQVISFEIMWENMVEVQATDVNIIWPMRVCILDI